MCYESGFRLQNRKTFLNYLEDLEDLVEAEEIMKDHKPEDAISLDEIIKKYGLEN